MGWLVNDLRRLLFLSEVDPAVSDKLPRTVNVAHIQVLQANQRLHVLITWAFQIRPDAAVKTPKQKGVSAECIG